MSYEYLPILQLKMNQKMVRPWPIIWSSKKGPPPPGNPGGCGWRSSMAPGPPIAPVPSDRVYTSFWTPTLHVTFLSTSSREEPDCTHTYIHTYIYIYNVYIIYMPKCVEANCLIGHYARWDNLWSITFEGWLPMNAHDTTPRTTLWLGRLVTINQPHWKNTFGSIAKTSCIWSN